MTLVSEFEILAENWLKETARKNQDFGVIVDGSK